MKSGLIWEDLAEMMNYGTSIAFHDVNTNAISNVDSIVTHFEYSQDSILLHLSGRGCKMLSEPNGNRAYITAAQRYSPIQIMTAQAQTVKLYTSRVENHNYHGMKKSERLFAWEFMAREQTGLNSSYG